MFFLKGFITCTFRELVLAMKEAPWVSSMWVRLLTRNLSNFSWCTKKLDGFFSTNLHYLLIKLLFVSNIFRHQKKLGMFFFLRTSNLHFCGVDLNANRSSMGSFHVNSTLQKKICKAFFIIERSSTGFFGANLHYLSIKPLSTSNVSWRQEKFNGFSFARFLTCSFVELLSMPREGPWVLSMWAQHCRKNLPSFFQRWKKLDRFFLQQSSPSSSSSSFMFLLTLPNLWSLSRLEFQWAFLDAEKSLVGFVFAINLPFFPLPYVQCSF